MSRSHLIPPPPTPGLTTVALPVPDATLYQSLHPQRGANAALCVGVTVAMARALQKAACKEAEVTTEKRIPGFACGGFSPHRPQTDASC